MSPERAVAGLPRPTTPEGRAGLDALVSAPGSALIASDYDGTLSPIVSDPAAARGLPSAIAALRRLAPCIGTLAVIANARHAWREPGGWWRKANSTMLVLACLAALWFVFSLHLLGLHLNY